ncbi:hypothetical protein Tco_0827099 [Tanacetum coccineum]
MKREGKDFSGRVTPLFATMMVQANQEEGVDSGIPTASQQTPITIQPSTSKPQKKQSRRKQKKTTAVPHPSDSTAGVPNEEFVPTHSNDPLLSGEDRLKLTDLTDMCTKLSERVLDLEHTKIAQAKEITNLKPRGRSIEDNDKDAEVSLVDETQGRSNDAKMFDTDTLTGCDTRASTEYSTIAPSIISKAKGITFRDAGESTTRTPTLVSSSSIKDKGKAKMDEPEVPLKKKDQIALDEEIARNLEAQIQAKLIEEERLARKKEEEANIALISSEATSRRTGRDNH